MADEIKKAESKGAEKKPVSKKPGFFARLKNFWKETKSEVKKVVWPTPKQVINNTVIVIVVVVLAAVFIGVVDFLFKTIAGLLTL